MSASSDSVYSFQTVAQVALASDPLDSNILPRASFLANRHEKNAKTNTLQSLEPAP